MKLMIKDMNYCCPNAVNRGYVFEQAHCQAICSMAVSCPAFEFATLLSAQKEEDLPLQLEEKSA